MEFDQMFEYLKNMFEYLEKMQYTGVSKSNFLKSNSKFRRKSPKKNFYDGSRYK